MINEKVRYRNNDGGLSHLLYFSKSSEPIREGAND